MASHHHHHASPPPSSNCCCCNPPSYTCCIPSPPQDHHLLQLIASLLSQQQQQHHHLLPTHYPKSHTHNQHQIHPTISSLHHRIESLESSLNHHSSHSLLDTAARVIQIHFRSFLVRRSKTLRHLKHLASINSTFNALKSSFSIHTTHLRFPALSHEALDLLLQLDSIEDITASFDPCSIVAQLTEQNLGVVTVAFVRKGCDPMVIDEKRSISRDLILFLDSIERVAVKKHLICIKEVKNARFGQKVNKSRDSGDDEKRKLLQSLRGRVEKISRLCKVSENDEDSEPEGIHDDDGDDDGVPSVLISRRNGVSPNKNGVFIQRHGVQAGAKRSVRFAENGKIFEVHSSNTFEPDLRGDITCLDGSSSSDDQGEVLENVGCAVEDVLDSSQGAEDVEEGLEEDGGLRCNGSDGERSTTRDLKNDGRNIVKGQLLAHREKLLFSAPLPLKMENKADAKSKGVRILT